MYRTSDQELDLLIENGRVVDGVGNPWFRADIGVKDGRIVTVGVLDAAQAQRTIDASGMIVAPGIIDIHGHSDLPVLAKPRAESMVEQGVTTNVVGNCGISLFPVTERNRHLLWGPLERESYYSHYHPERTRRPIEWETLEGYLGCLEEQGVSLNVAALVGHSTVRMAVMGKEDRLATREELEEMKSLVEQGMEEGAFGLSTGLEYSPGPSSSTDEVVALAEVVAGYGGIYATHIRNRDVRFMEATREAIEIGERAGLPVQLSHFIPRYPAYGKTEEALGLIEEARERGLDVTADSTLVTAVWGGFYWGLSRMESELLPGTLDGGLEKTLQRLRDPGIREKLKKYDNPQYKQLSAGEWDKVLLYNMHANAGLNFVTMDEVAKIRGVDDPYDALFDILIEEGEGLFDVSLAAAIYTEEDLRNVIEHPAVALESDNIHRFPRLFAKYVREEKVLTLEDAIRKMTSLPAQRMGIRDRGQLREGMWGDIFIFDLEEIDNEASFKNPDEHPRGIKWVLVNGEVVMDHGQHTGALPGAVLRRP